MDHISRPPPLPLVIASLFSNLRRFGRFGLVALWAGGAGGGCLTTATPEGNRLWSARADPRLLGERLLVVFMPDDWPAQLDEPGQEIYAAWAGLLEEFVRGSGALLEVRKVDFRKADEVFIGRGLPANEYSLLVVRGDGLGLFADDPILNGRAYDYAEAFLGGMERDFYWPAILHMGESETSIPREWKLVRLRPGHFAPLPAPAAPPSAAQPAPVLTRPAGPDSAPVVPGPGA